MQLYATGQNVILGHGLTLGLFVLPCLFALEALSGGRDHTEPSQYTQYEAVLPDWYCFAKMQHCLNGNQYILHIVVMLHITAILQSRTHALPPGQVPAPHTSGSCR